MNKLTMPQSEPCPSHTAKAKSLRLKDARITLCQLQEKGHLMQSHLHLIQTQSITCSYH